MNGYMKRITRGERRARRSTSPPRRSEHRTRSTRCWSSARSSGFAAASPSRTSATVTSSSSASTVETASRESGIRTRSSPPRAQSITRRRCARSTRRAASRGEMHSEMAEEERDEVIDLLRRGEIDCMVQVQMLGEGFDHPRSRVAAIFRPFRTLSPFIQFVGRIMRVAHRRVPEHPDNRGFVVSHVGLHNDAPLERVPRARSRGAASLHGWIDGEGDETPPARARTTPAARRGASTLGAR